MRTGHCNEAPHVKSCDVYLTPSSHLRKMIRKFVKCTTAGHGWIWWGRGGHWWGWTELEFISM